MKKYKFGRFFGYAFRKSIQSWRETLKGNILCSIIAVFLSYGVMSYRIEVKEITTQAIMALSLVVGTIVAQIIHYLLLLLFAPVMILQEQDKILESYKKTISRTNIIIRLTELRRKGVVLRNEGEGLLSPDNVKLWWDDKFGGWKREVIDTMSLQDPIQAKQWETLDTYKIKRQFPRAVNPEHAHDLQMFDAWLERLQERIDGFQKQDVTENAGN